MLRALIDKNTKTREDLLSFIEFAYNRVVHIVTKCLPFEIVYGFNPLTPIDLLSFPSNEVVNFQTNEKVNTILELHEEVKKRIEKQNAKIEKINQHQKSVIFMEGGLVYTIE